MALSESGGTIRRITARSRHLEKMNVVGARREHAKRMGQASNFNYEEDILWRFDY